MENKKLIIALSVIGAVSGVIALLNYVEGQEKKKLDTEIAHIDKQIKMLDLQSKLDKSKIS